MAYRSSRPPSRRLAPLCQDEAKIAVADAPERAVGDRRGDREAARRLAMIAIVAARQAPAVGMAGRRRGATAVATSAETAEALDVATVVARRLARPPVDATVVRGAPTLHRTAGRPAQAVGRMPVAVDLGETTEGVAPSARTARDPATSRRDRRSTRSAA